MSQENEEVTAENQEQQNQDKVAKKFDAAFKKLVALMGGPDNLRKTTIPNDEVGEIVNKLLADRRKAKIEAFSKGASDILDKKIEFDKECRKAEEQFKNTVNAKKKEFTEQMTKLFQELENINELEKSYYSNLKGE